MKYVSASASLFSTHIFLSFHLEWSSYSRSKTSRKELGRQQERNRACQVICLSPESPWVRVVKCAGASMTLA